MKRKINDLLTNLIALFYPVTCMSCGRVLLQHEKHICLHCMAHLPETNYHLDKDNPLNLIFLGRVPIENVASFLFFKKGELVQKMLHELKYNGNQDIGDFLGECYGKKLANTQAFASIDMILPIPLHKKKLRLRGYNQSECIAKGLSRSMGIPYRTDILVRTEYTETQTHKSRFNRWENVKEVFAVENEEDIKGKHILICDDVLTTGATTEAAVEKILQAADVKVSVVTLACAS
ncbi:MAG: ComF family protein [Bacteroidales bacterium]|nr:ComF family protein [Bacteroidales bacterium]MBQ7489161.1 ComF family protein [Bacteroidales bacterium]